jgi:hypothetical protein
MGKVDPVAGLLDLGLERNLPPVTGEKESV